MIFSSEMTVKLLRFSGSDKDVCNDARISTDTADYDIPEEILSGRDEGLINYLMKNRHGTPFSGNFFKFHIQAPIFVFRQLFKHTVGWNYNEQSARYSELEPKFYRPAMSRPLMQTGKPGHYQFEQGPLQQWTNFTTDLGDVCMRAWIAYQEAIKNEVANEVARMVLPVNIYSKVIASCNARSLMHLLSLRTRDENSLFPSYPQYEIEQMAIQMEAIFAEKMPVTYAAFVKNRRIDP